MAQSRLQQRRLNKAHHDLAKPQTQFLKIPGLVLLRGEEHADVQRMRIQLRHP